MWFTTTRPAKRCAPLAFIDIGTYTGLFSLVAASAVPDLRIIAYDLLAEAELPSQPFANFFIKMKKKYGDMDGILKLISSHPGLDGRAQRAAAADRIGDGTYEPVLDDQDWIALRGICQGGLPTVRRGHSTRRGALPTN